MDALAVADVSCDGAAATEGQKPWSLSSWAELASLAREPAQAEDPDLSPVPFIDSNGFKVDILMQDAVTLTQVERRMRQRAKLWAEEDRLRGPLWFQGLKRASTLTGAHIRNNLATHLLAPTVSRLITAASSSSSTASGSPGSRASSDASMLENSCSGSNTNADSTRANNSSKSSSSSKDDREPNSLPFAPFLVPSAPQSQRFASLRLKQLIRQGVPAELRPSVWMATSGAHKLREEEGGAPYYLALVETQQGLVSEATLQIDSDLHRTLPGHPKVDTPEGLAQLRRMLVSYSLRNSRVGYCQGMNYVAAFLLLVMELDEERAFWMLCTTVENVLFHDCFSEDLFGCHVEQGVLKELLKAKRPKLAEALDSLGFEISLVATEWFLCLFAKSLPSETALRVWDVLFNEGAKILFRVALTLFQINEEALMECLHLGEAVEVLVKSAATQYDPDALLQVAFKQLGSFPMSIIHDKRRQKSHEVAAALDLRQRQLADTPLTSCSRGHLKSLSQKPPTPKGAPPHTGAFSENENENENESEADARSEAHSSEGETTKNVLVRPSLQRASSSSSM